MLTYMQAVWLDGSWSAERALGAAQARPAQFIPLHCAVQKSCAEIVVEVERELELELELDENEWVMEGGGRERGRGLF